MCEDAVSFCIATFSLKMRLNMLTAIPAAVFKPFACYLIRGSHIKFRAQLHKSCCCFRFASRCHPCCCAGSVANLYPAGRGNVVSVQEELWTFPAAPHTRQRLFQANGLAGYGVRWKRSHRRPGASPGRVAHVGLFLPRSLCCPPALCHLVTVRYGCRAAL